MPWKQVWEPPHRNDNIKCHADLPEWATERGMSGFGPREADGYNDSKRVHLYFCHHCKGWVEGWPDTHGENSIGPLSGRSGTVYECARCGEEFHFDGMVS